MITYAGETLLLADPGRQFNDWLDRLLSLEDFGPLNDPLSYADGRCNPRGTAKAFVGIPRSNWRFRPRWKLNTLWWPTGAARWATGLFLADEATLDRIVEGLDSQGGATLVLSSKQPGETITAGTDPTKISPTMYLLPPRQVTCDSHPIEGDPQPQLWLLPLVDERYFWQFKDVGLLEVDSDTSWDRVFLHIESQLGNGVGIAFGEVPSEYGQPDPEALTRRYENAAVLLDAVTWSIGKRIVAEITGGYTAQDYESAHANYIINTDSSWYQSATMAGGKEYGQWTSYAAETVRVVYPRYAHGVPQADGDVYSISTTRQASDAPASVLTIPGTIKTFFDTAAADLGSSAVSGADGWVTGLDSTGSPDNLDALQALTKQIAKDYYGYCLPNLYDVTVAGVYNWNPSGFDDWICWHVGYQYPGRPTDDAGDAPTTYGEYGCFTRACSVPYNWGFTELLHQIPSESGSSSSSHSSSGGSSMSSESSSGGSSVSSESSTSSSASSGSAVCVTPESRGLAELPGYDAAAKQALIHTTEGCLEWMTIEVC